MTNMDIDVVIYLYSAMVSGGLVLGITWALLFSFWR